MRMINVADIRKSYIPRGCPRRAFSQIICVTTITEIYEGTYGFSTGLAGLSFLGIGIGMFTGLGLFGATTDKRLQAKKAKGDVSPEIRLEGLIPAAFCIPIGLFWYGW